MIDQNIIPTIRDLYPIPVPFHGIVILLDLLATLLLLVVYEVGIGSHVLRSRHRFRARPGRSSAEALRWWVVISVIKTPCLFVLLYPVIATVLYGFCGGLFR